MSSPESSKALASQPSPVRPPSVSAAPSPVASQYVSTKRNDDQPDRPLQRTTPLEWIHSRIVIPTRTTIQQVNTGSFVSALRVARSRLNFSSSSRTEARKLSNEQDSYLRNRFRRFSEGFPPADAPACEKGLAPPTHSGASGAKNEASAMPTLSVSQETKQIEPTIAVPEVRMLGSSNVTKGLAPPTHGAASGDKPKESTPPTHGAVQGTRLLAAKSESWARAM